MKIAYKYCDYLIERIAAAGDTEIAALDMSATTMHYRSSGALEPIEPAGMRPMYRIVDVDVPGWLIAGVKAGQRKGAWTGGSADYWAAKFALGERGADGWAAALRPLITKTGSFAKSLQSWYAQHGYLTDKQASAVTCPYRRRNNW